jgi:hypothetical protein
LVEQYADKNTAENMAEAWRGGAYYAASNKNANMIGTARIGLIYLSRWTSQEAANEFAKIYADYLSKRYSNVTPIVASEVNCGAGEDCDVHKVSAFNTNEGLVWIQRVDGAGVLISEGFNAATSSKLRWQILSANPVNSVQVQKRSLTSPWRTSAVIQEALDRMLAHRLVDLLKAR